MTKQQFYEQERLKGNTEHITGDPEPDYSLPFYQEIFDLMEAYIHHLSKERNSFYCEEQVNEYKKCEIQCNYCKDKPKIQKV